MKKLSLILLLLTTALLSQAQVSLVVVTAPCDSNGVLVCNVSGSGTGTYEYEWATSGAHITHTTTASTDTFRYFGGGTVQVYAFLAGVYVGAADSFFRVPFYAEVTATSATCPSTGSLSASVTGGTGPYTYQWVNMTGTVVGTTNPLSVAAGEYQLKVTDAAGCYATFPDSSAIDSSGYYVSTTPDFTYSVASTYDTCPKPDTLTVFISGGVSPFSYNWTTSGGVVVSTSNPALFYSNGLYYGTVTDALGCTANLYEEAYMPADFSVYVNTTDADCTNGTATSVITGGSAPYSYLWTNGATTPGLTGLVQGDYDVTVTDAVGCVGTGYSTVDQTIDIMVNTTSTPATCLDSNGSAIAFGSGGVTPYTYLWSNGATTQSVTGLRPTFLNVTATDANGCFGASYASITASTPIIVTYSSTASSCTSGTGTSTLTISGGTAPYTVIWYTYPPQSGITATALMPGYYNFLVTDASGCTQTGTVNVPPVDVMSFSFLTYPDTCARTDGKIVATASSGVAPYTYSWSNGATTSTITGLNVGTYYLTVTDAHGCTATQCQTVPYSSPLALGLTTTPASCLYNHDGTIVATAVDGTPPYNYIPGGSSMTSATIGSLATGPYWIGVTDAEGCFAEKYTYVNYNIGDSSCFCVVHGTVYHDTNANCIHDIGEPGVQHIQLQCTSVGYTYSDTAGQYCFLVPSGSYTISQRIEAYYPLSHCQSNSISYTAVAGTGCATTIDFADSIAPIHDMHVCTWDYAPAVPGNTYIQKTVISNRGTQNEPAILASYTPDGQLLAPTFLPSGVYTGSSYYYNTADTFPTLSPGASADFFISYSVPTDVPLGTVVNFKDTIVYQSPMSNWLTDYSPWDNVENYNTIVVASHDPNFMEVDPQGSGSAGDITYTESDTVLEFMVHFQNTGTYPAQNVTVQDTLDANLDWSSLTPVYSSNPGTVKVNETGVATFTFPDINLATANSQPITSNAMFTYRVSMKPGLAMGTQIHAHSAIYFDFNAPVPTDTTVTTLVSQVGVSTVTKVNANSFTIYPNPAGNSCTALVNSPVNCAATILITDLQGRQVQLLPANLVAGTQQVQLNTAQYAPGMYFVTISGAGNTMTQKLVIMK